MKNSIRRLLLIASIHPRRTRMCRRISRIETGKRYIGNVRSIGPRAGTRCKWRKRRVVFAGENIDSRGGGRRLTSMLERLFRIHNDVLVGRNNFGGHTKCSWMLWVFKEDIVSTGKVTLKTCASCFWNKVLLCVSREAEAVIGTGDTGISWTTHGKDFVSVWLSLWVDGVAWLTADRVLLVCMDQVRWEVEVSWEDEDNDKDNVT
jgi:hypothetical protein